MSDRPEHNKLDSDCTLPPDHPLPPDQLGRYSPERDFYAEKDIADYVEGQARDETVQNVERVKTEYVIGTSYEIWDVSTDKDRWWVITNPTNLVVADAQAGLDAEALSEFVAAHLARYKRPRAIHSVSSLPKDANGRLDRAGISAEYKPG